MQSLQHGVGRHVLAARRHRAHVDARGCAASSCGCGRRAARRRCGAASGRPRSPRCASVGKVAQEALQQLVDDARLAGAAGAGDAEDRRLAAGELPLPCAGARARASSSAPSSIADEHRADARSRRRCRGALPVARSATPSRARARRTTSSIIATQAHAACRRSGDRCARRRRPASSRDFLRRDRAAAAAEHADVRGAALACSMSTMYLKYSTWPPW